MGAEYPIAVRLPVPADPEPDYTFPAGRGKSVPGKVRVFLE